MIQNAIETIIKKKLISLIFRYKLYALCLLTFTLLALPIECYTQSVSHIPQLQKGNSFVLITDLSGNGPSVAVSFYDDSGREVSVINKLLRPNGKLQIIVDEHLKVSGCIVAESQSELVLAEYWQINKDGTLSVMPFQSVSGGERYLINCFRFPFCKETYLVLSDPNGNGPIAQMEFYSKTGELIKIIRKMLQPHGTLVLKVSDHIDKNMQGKVSVRGFGGGISIYGIHINNKKPILILPTYISSKELIINDVLIDNGFMSDIVVTDASAKGTNIKVSLLDTDGNLLNEIERSLSANSTMPLNIADHFGNIEGGVIKIRGRSEILANYWERNTKTGDCLVNSAIDNPAMSSISKYTENLLSVSYFAFDDNVEFMLYFLNIGNKPVIAELEFYNSEGAKIGSKIISLEPDRSIRESANQFFGKSRLGTIVVKNPNSSLVVTSGIHNINNGRLLGKIYAVSR
jgi:hypothetical protein